MNIWKAAEEGYYWVVAAILRRDGGKVRERDANGETPLLLAASQGHTETLRLLIDGMTALNIDIGNPEMYKYINGKIPLHRAAARGAEDSVIRLLLRYFPVNTRSGPSSEFGSHRLDGATALHWAAANGKMKTVRFLLGMGANPNDSTKTGWTALGVAIDMKHWDIARLLYSKTSNTTAYDLNRGLYGLENRFWHPKESILGCKRASREQGEKWANWFPCSDSGKLRAEEFFAESGSEKCYPEASRMLALHREKCERSGRLVNRKRGRDDVVSIS